MRVKRSLDHLVFIELRNLAHITSRHTHVLISSHPTSRPILKGSIESSRTIFWIALSRDIALVFEQHAINNKEEQSSWKTFHRIEPLHVLLIHHHHQLSRKRSALQMSQVVADAKNAPPLPSSMHRVLLSCAVRGALTARTPR